ncbi:TatD family hydrolase [Flavobacterium tegetincola]|uniref:TatD family hydrolase n=1 Tax=Flavobacterium tegetincola TaxID=150172 RepID=UPI00041522B1|nr:TatD family hydrolase [Flavobacterium tegetincola]
MKYINIHTHESSGNPAVLDVVNQYPSSFEQTDNYFSIGIHPWYINAETWKQELNVIEEKLQLKNCLALGECGLDKRRETPIEFQLEVFEAQLLLAEKYQKPVIIHCVAAFQEVIATKIKLKISVPMVIHGFSKSQELAAQLLKNDFYISFGKYLIKNPELKSVFEIMPNNRFFLETDTIQEGIEEVYDLAAKYKNIDVVTLQQIVTKNFKTVFKDGRMDGTL